jgi:hypothetical protein
LDNVVRAQSDLENQPNWQFGGKNFPWKGEVGWKDLNLPFHCKFHHFHLESNSAAPFGFQAYGTTNAVNCTVSIWAY